MAVPEGGVGGECGWSLQQAWERLRCLRTCVLAAGQDHAGSHIRVLEELKSHEPVVGGRLRGG